MQNSRNRSEANLVLNGMFEVKFIQK